MVKRLVDAIFQEQYEFLQRALVHALTIDCAPVTADQLETYISKTGQEQREKQFNVNAFSSVFNNNPVIYNLWNHWNLTTLS